MKLWFGVWDSVRSGDRHECRYGLGIHSIAKPANTAIDLECVTGRFHGSDARRPAGLSAGMAFMAHACANTWRSAWPRSLSESAAVGECRNGLDASDDLFCQR